MAEVNWTLFPSGLASGSVDRGVTNGHSTPPGGGSWCYGWNSLTADVGAVGKYVNAVDFAPLAKGASFRVAMRRVSAASCTPFAFVCLQGGDVHYEGYLIGLAHDENPARIVVVKGTPSLGLRQSVAVMKSSQAFEPANWIHLRLDVIRQPSDDVKLQVFRNDLDAHDVDSPVWNTVPGLTDLVDDALGITTGKQPYLGGYAGVGFYTGAVSRYGFVDYVECLRQL